MTHALDVDISQVVLVTNDADKVPLASPHHVHTPELLGQLIVLGRLNMLGVAVAVRGCLSDWYIKVNTNVKHDQHLSAQAHPTTKIARPSHTG